MRKEPREIETIEMEVEAVPLAAVTLLSAVHVRCFHPAIGSLPLARRRQVHQGRGRRHQRR